MLTVSRTFELMILPDEVFKPTRDADIFRVLMQSAAGRLNCRFGTTSGLVELTDLFDHYKCSKLAVTEFSMLKVFVDDVLVATSSDLDSTYFFNSYELKSIFFSSLILPDKSNFQLGIDLTLTASLFLANDSSLDSIRFACLY